MRKGPEIVVVLLIVLMSAGCSAGRKRATAGRSDMPSDAGYAAVIGSVRESNITDGGFVLKKGRIELEGTELDGSFGLIARMNNRGDFYASVRGPLGIEMVRLMAVGNEIAVLDRINRIAYVGKRDDVMRKNGLPGDIMKTILGDMPEWDGRRSGLVNGKIIQVSSGDDYFVRDITICLDEMKVCGERIKRAGSIADQIEINYSDFRVAGDKKYASVITLDDKTRMFHVKLDILELTTGNDAEISFTLPSYVIKPL